MLNITSVYLMLRVCVSSGCHSIHSVSSGLAVRPWMFEGESENICPDTHRYVWSSPLIKEASLCMRQGPQRTPTEEDAELWLPVPMDRYISYLSYTALIHLLGDGTTHGGLGPSTTGKQDNTPQTRPQHGSS